MRSLRAWFLRVVGSLVSSRRDADLADELRSHLELHIDENLRAGMSPEEARRQALLKLGGVAQTREAHRDRGGLPWVDSLARDVKYAFRLLRRSPGFTAVAVLSLALGIGANTAIFSLVDSLLLRSLPVRQPDRLIQLSVSTNRSSWTYPQWEQIRDRTDLFDGTCAWSGSRYNLASGGEAHEAFGLLVSGGFFRVLGVSPIVGRGITAEDDRPGGGPDGPVAVISDDFWQTHFGGAADVLGRGLTVNGTRFTVVGVTPAGFDGPSPGNRFDFAIPLGMTGPVTGRDLPSSRSTWWLKVMARLKDGQTVAAASAALRAAQPAIRQATLPTTYRPDQVAGYLKEPFTVRLAPTGTDSYLREQYRLPLLALMVVVALVLLMASVNVANLLLARADARRHELGVRLALGASRTQLVRQLLVESLLLSCVGAALGGLLAMWGSRLLVSQIVAMPSIALVDLSPNLRVLAFTALVTIAVALLFGTAPALRATSVRPSSALGERGAGTGSVVRWRLGTLLMVAQVGLCLVLAAGAGLFGRTFTALASQHLGFVPDGVLMANLEQVVPDSPSPIDTDAVLEDVRATPGVRSAAISALVPLDHREWDQTLENPEELSLPEADRDVWMNAVSPDWFPTVGTPIVAGRDFSRRDAAGSPPVAIVNQAFADRFLPGAHAIGRTVRLVSSPRRPEPVLTIVGVVGNAVYESQRQRVPPTLYRPMTQAGEDIVSPVLVVRSASGPTSALTGAVSAAIARADPNLTFTFRTMSGLVGDSLASERILAMLSGFFGALALLLAAIGLYGVVSYMVNRRRTEIGIRMALGARPGGIVRMMLRRIGLVMAIGLAIGAVVSIWLAHFVKALLYGVQPGDPITLAGAVAVLALVGVLAAWMPARRAARIDPMEALREQ